MQIQNQGMEGALRDFILIVKRQPRHTKTTIAILTPKQIVRFFSIDWKPVNSQYLKAGEAICEYPLKWMFLNNFPLLFSLATVIITL